MGFYPAKLELYKIALTHRSTEYTDKKGKNLNNERLEYLGDAILESVVSDILFHKYPNKREGFLTSARSNIVKRATLNKLADNIGLTSLIHCNISSSIYNKNLGGNAFEALIGAIYLDKGFNYCLHFIQHRILKKHLKLEDIVTKEVNFKSKLLEWGQKHQYKIDFILQSQEITDNNIPFFVSLIKIEGISLGKGRGHSKKDSQQKAAQKTIEILQKETKVMHLLLKRKTASMTEIKEAPDATDCNETKSVQNISQEETKEQ